MSGISMISKLLDPTSMGSSDTSSTSATDPSSDPSTDSTEDSTTTDETTTEDQDEEDWDERLKALEAGQNSPSAEKSPVSS